MKALLLVACLVADIMLGIWVAHQTGWVAVLVAWAVAIGIGLLMMRSAARVLGPALSRGSLAGSADDAGVDALVTAFAAVLFILPGFISDVLAILLLLPPVRAMVKRKVASVMQQRSGMLQQLLNDVTDTQG